MMRRVALPAAAVIAALVAAATAARAGDWPQILGPGRNGHAAADEKVVPWPAAGPRVVLDVERRGRIASVSLEAPTQTGVETPKR